MYIAFFLCIINTDLYYSWRRLHVDEARMRNNDAWLFSRTTYWEDRRETMNDSGFRMNHSTISVVITCFPYVVYRQGHVWKHYTCTCV